MRYAAYFLVHFALVAIIAGAGGCSGGHNLAQVHGTVTYQGKPLKNGTIIIEVSGNRPAYGQIVDGQIVNVSTFEQNDGVPVGEATIAINSISEPSADSKAGAGGSSDRPSESGGIVTGKNILPLRYANPATSGLTATISAGDNELSFDLSK
ncbi:hypothetical protein AB1L30_22355 [Bremerella sp. JC817]|uniref:hypothetical protein n=1 Tax=Bremerella sp. JC817 TaxID=3231756 RepID=UPI003459AC75